MASEDRLHSVLDKDSWTFDDIKTFLERDSSSINDADQHLDTPLLRVLQKKDCCLEVVKLLLQFGADVNGREEKHPLNVALRFPVREDIIEALLEKGAVVNSSSRCLALHCGSSKSLVERLLDCCSMSEFCKHGSALHCAVDSPRSGLKHDVLQLLIDRGADVRAQVGKSSTVLCYALKNGNEASTIQFLMDAGASLKECVIHSSPLLCATVRHSYGAPLQAEVVQLLLQSGASVDVCSSEGYMPLHGALVFCVYEMEAIKLLLSCLPDIDPFKEGYLRVAVAENPHCNPAIVKLFINHGVDINNISQRDESALTLALERCHDIHVIKALLESGADFHQKDMFGLTPIKIALSLCKDADIFEELLSAGALIERSVFVDRIPSIPNHFSFACVKVLLRYFILQNSSSEDIVSLFQPYQDYGAILKFVDECNAELQKMKTKQIGEDFTLYEFLSDQPSYKCYGRKRKAYFIKTGDSYQIVNDQPSPQICSVVRNLPGKKYDFDRLLTALLYDTYPVYFNIISAKVGKDPEAQASMEKMLEKVQVHTVTSSLTNTCAEKKMDLKAQASMEKMLEKVQVHAVTSPLANTCAEKVQVHAVTSPLDNTCAEKVQVHTDTSPLANTCEILQNSAEKTIDLKAQASMEKMLEKVQVHTVTSPLSNTCAEKKISLPYDIACKIAGFSKGGGLLGLILAFYNPREHPSCTAQSGIEDNSCKRKAECDFQSPKQPKLH